MKNCCGVMINTSDPLTFLTVNTFLTFFCLFEAYLLGYQFPSKLNYVNIFFDTPTFDKITKDRSAKVSI